MADAVHDVDIKNLSSTVAAARKLYIKAWIVTVVGMVQNVVWTGHAKTQPESSQQLPCK